MRQSSKRRLAEPKSCTKIGKLSRHRTKSYALPDISNIRMTAVTYTSSDRCNPLPLGSCWLRALVGRTTAGPFC